MTNFDGTNRWSRRAVLKCGALTPLALSCARLEAAVESMTALPLITKVIPRSGQRIPAVGLGTNRFGVQQPPAIAGADNSGFHSASYDDVRAILAKMHELGGTVIDTAAGYGDSEILIGRALSESGLARKMFIATKFNAQGATLPLPPDAPPVGENEVFGPGAFDRSLARLRVERVDLLFAHFLSSTDPLMPLMSRLKHEGKVRYIGTTVGMLSLHTPLAVKTRQYPLDFIQVDYSIGNRDAAETVFPTALERDTAVMIDQPLHSHAGPLLSRVAGVPLPSWAAEIDVTSWNQFFIKYAISHPAVTCAIPGSTRVEHLVENQLAGRGRMPDAAMRLEMERYWDAHAKA